MTRYSFYIASFTSEPFQPPPELKVPDVVVEANRLARLTFIQLAISPKVYSSLEELKQVTVAAVAKQRSVLSHNASTDTHQCLAYLVG